jgi:presenilin-like A22 family membrane protease
MKHDLKVTIFLLLLFLSAQITGLFVLNHTINVEETYNETTGETEIIVNYQDVMTGRPETQGAGSFLYVFFAILFGTILLLILIKFKLHKVWKGWFYIAIGLTLSIVFDVFLSEIISLILGFGLAYLKIFKPNIFTHNLTEIFMYSGIALMIVPLFNILWVIILLIAISIYDIIAVFKSKHMIKLAEFQSSSKMFAGLLIPYKKPKKPKTTSKIKMKIPKGIKTEGVKSAILGGGDIAFPLIFSGVVMHSLIQIESLTQATKHLAFLKVLIIPVFAMIGLGTLLYLSKKNKFYPAMPFISAGCLIGYGIILII